MKYILIYSYTTTNYNVYICKSRDARKNGMKFYLPRFIEEYRNIKRETDIIIHEAKFVDTIKNEKYTPITYKQEDLFYVEG